MGPEATVQTFNFIVKRTKAKTDQENIPIIIFNNPKIPDRTDAIIGNGESPLPYLVESAKFLEISGADLIIMPCNTAHYYYKEIIKHLKIPFLHLHWETLNYVKTKHGHLRKLGLLATTGTLETELYQKCFNKHGFKILIPDPHNQKSVMESLYGEKGIKAGFKRQPKKLLLKVVADLKKKKADAIIAGCTEISLVLGEEALQLPIINPIKIIALSAIKKAGYKIK